MFNAIPTNKAIEEWNKLLENHQEGVTIANNPALFHFYHDYLSLPSYYVFLKKDNVVEGLFSFVKSGRVYISMPHFSYGGIIWLNKKNSSADPVLIEKIVASVKEDTLLPGFYDVDYVSAIEREGLKDPQIEIRLTQALYGTTPPDKVVHLISFKGLNKLDLSFFKQNLRRKITKASKEGIHVIKGGGELINDFSKVYDKNMHRKGSPTLGREFLSELNGTTGINSEIFVAYFNGKPVGGAFSMWYDGYYENTWFSTLNEYNKNYVSYILHWEMMKSAFDKKVLFYSMGRSTIDSGTHQYKKQWPTEEVDLFFSTNCPGPAKLKKLAWAPKVWKYLPASIVNRIGPKIARRIY